ncbi:TPA: restriction endonuclease subunit S [Escherichia coli]|uniref:restriction endonuclease subunit S n=1 Tax=Escherichia coli TaxID=562 RepID=UPI001C5EF57F|nr:restriction endonuclease subunit S [Escherichia coli]
MDAKRERYTPNDVGPSPLEWKAPRLSEVSTLITNGFVGTVTPFYTDITGVPYLYGTNVRANKLETNEIRYVTREFHTAQSKTALKAGDLLTVQSGHIGETAVVTDQFHGANCHALIVTRLKQEKADPHYLCFYVNSEIGRARMKGLEVGSTILHINTKDLKKFRVLLPSLPEQKKIAQILSTWDKAISVTEKLLTNSQQQKKALMQQLLTGKKRLLDENGVRFIKKWEKTTLGDIAKITTGSSNRQDSSLDGKYTFFDRSEDIRTSSIYLFDGEAIIVPGEGQRFEPKYFIGKFDLHQRTYAIMDFASHSGRFLFYMIDYLKVYFLNQAVGSTVKSLRLPMFQKMTFEAPEIEEQQKIAAVLSAADAEISTLEKKLACLKGEKKALMQQLLTGKRRVVVDVDAA